MDILSQGKVVGTCKRVIWKDCGKVTILDCCTVSDFFSLKEITLEGIKVNLNESIRGTLNSVVDGALHWHNITLNFNWVSDFPLVYCTNKIRTNTFKDGSVSIITELNPTRNLDQGDSPTQENLISLSKPEVENLIEALKKGQKLAIEHNKQETQ